MASHNDTQRLTTYTPSNLPSIGTLNLYVANELSNVSKSLTKIIEVMKLLEARMNTNGLS